MIPDKVKRSMLATAHHVLDTKQKSEIFDNGALAIINIVLYAIEDRHMKKDDLVTQLKQVKIDILADYGKLFEGSHKKIG